nr:MAG TPA: hypothetical protein [Caudoviricetes sp.]
MIECGEETRNRLLLFSKDDQYFNLFIISIG